jgi:hypothetical protein
MPGDSKLVDDMLQKEDELRTEPIGHYERYGPVLAKKSPTKSVPGRKLGNEQGCCPRTLERPPSTILLEQSSSLIIY